MHDATLDIFVDAGATGEHMAWGMVLDVAIQFSRGNQAGDSRGILRVWPETLKGEMEAAMRAGILRYSLRTPRAYLAGLHGLGGHATRARKQVTLRMAR